jgi:putative transposase
MEIVCGDYVTEDIACRIEDKVFRTHVCVFMDMRSRMIVGWSLQKTANSVGVVRALKMMVDRYGTAEKVYVGNGREFKNYWLCGGQWQFRKTMLDPELIDHETGVLIECGMHMVFCLAKHGQSKPIERFNRTFHDRFEHPEPTYLGSDYK